jgi:hypothetical protein
LFAEFLDSINTLAFCKEAGIELPFYIDQAVYRVTTVIRYYFSTLDRPQIKGLNIQNSQKILKILNSVVESYYGKRSVSSLGLRNFAIDLSLDPDNPFFDANKA